ncbi:single-stranded DNA-binding protein [Pseudanabaena sp. FACHB-2040]|uniref:single-stranded DNA-binding protein n=1 Tax=Pseudanabaena sp. FACHB-2040 TaxID=2692859 RepID=UPI0016851334|nr:single-stranded DNA-binding protein [Pseudanabaena sp. FACHB-2040]MBD2259068.1 single-stranded DNA-binding protein [Pseudanabaena sp. FACHB-2040]
MNSCILMADIIQSPQLRYTSDNQTPIAEFVVQFPGPRPEDTPSQLKVIGWGNLAQEIQENYHEGDRVLLEGRLGMNTVDRPEGFKEKRAEMTVQRIHRLSALGELSMPPSPPSPALTAQTPAPAPAPSRASTTSAPGSFSTSTTSGGEAEPDYDDIPF